MKPTRLCKNLRTKKMFIPALADEAFAPPTDEVGHECHCWCNATLTATGPDDQPVGLYVCTPTRTCFED